MTISEMCDSLGAALISMLDGELVYVRLTDAEGELNAETAQTRLGPAGGIIPTLRRSLGSWLAQRNVGHGKTANPFGSGTLTIASADIGSRWGRIVIGSEAAEFPSASQRLLLDVAADQFSTALWRRRAEDAGTRYRATVNGSSEFIGIANLEGSTDYLNAAGRLLVGLGTADQLDGRHVLDFIAEADRDLVKKSVLPVAKRSGHWSGEFRLRHMQSGADIPVFADVFTIDHPRTEHPRNIATICRSVSGIERSQLQLRRTNEDLAERLALLTSELADVRERLLAEASERGRADAIGREVQLELYQAMRIGAAGEMAVNIAHELSQPLTAAANSLGAIRRTVASERPPAETLELVGEAADQIRRASTILRRLRGFIGHGKSTPRLEDVAAILDDAVGLAMVGASALGVRVAVHYDPDVSHVYVDRIQVQQVIVNLVRNAIEAMADSVRRELTIEVTRTPDDMIEVAVADSGPGLTEDVADRLFVPYVTTKGHGMGLGLAISRSMVQANGGDLTFGPGEGGGTVFRFTLAPRPPRRLQ
ncbi:ATP-binding protein [Devosia sp.]|uniref:sensor histidine kinase n=1 Tax=Devosia sp. TaxID=1871048 RepID=UPI00260C24EF|nr:ATP-binding protein [Devosia sp.]